jgi:hypothetical protein
VIFDVLSGRERYAVWRLRLFAAAFFAEPFICYFFQAGLTFEKTDAHGQSSLLQNRASLAAPSSAIQKFTPSLHAPFGNVFAPVEK